MKVSFLTIFAVFALSAIIPLHAQTMIIKTVAGNATVGYSGDGGPATAAALNWPKDLAVDAAGNIFIADMFNSSIRKVDAATGIITTIAGSTLGTHYFSGDGGPATDALLSYPRCVKLDGAGNIYIADVGNHRIRKITAATGIITTIAGGGTSAYHSGMLATDYSDTLQPLGLGVDAAGNCFFIDRLEDTHIARLVRLDAATGILTSVVNDANIPGFSGDGGLAINARIDGSNFVPGIAAAVNADGDMCFPDMMSSRIRRVTTATGIINTIAGTGSPVNSGDGGPSTSAGIGYPNCINFDNDGNMYFFTAFQIRRIDRATGIITTIAGGGSSYADDIIATNARLYSPSGVATDGAGNVYYCDENGTIRKITPVCNSVDAGAISSSAGSALCGSPVTILSLPTATRGLGISYQWKMSTDGITWSNVGTDSSSYVTGALPDTSYFKAFISCSYSGLIDSTATDTITFTPLPSAGTITGGIAICEGSATLLSSASSGGSWSSSAAAIADVSSGGIVTGIALGTAIITYSVTNSCGTDRDTIVVAVYPNPVVAPITGAAAICEGSITTMAVATTGGTWNSSATGVATISTAGVVTALAAGTTTIAYYVLSACGGAASSIIMTVNPLPVTGTITGAAVVCVGGTVVLSNAVTGGTWSSSDAGVAGISSSGTVTGVTVGSAVISYTVVNSCGPASATLPVLVDTLPVIAAITGTDSVCAGDVLTLTSATVGGSWTSSDPGIATVDMTTGIVAGVASGSIVVSYAVTGGCGTATATFPLRVRSAAACGTGVYGAGAASHGLTIYPDPNRGSFTISVFSAASEDINIEIVDITGRRVKNEIIKSNVATGMSLTAPAGMYMLHATGQNCSYTAKLVVIQ